MSKKILVAGGGGFIGGHLAKSLVSRGHDVRVVDVKPLDQWYQRTEGAENIVANLEEKDACFSASEGCDEVYNLACNMGGMGFIENNKALCMLSILINTHLLMAAKEFQIKKYLYSSSACVYAADKQTDTTVTALKEADAYPAMPEDGYGWEKLFSERMCKHFEEDFGMEVRVVRFHNVYGPDGTWRGGREKAPAALSRKIIEAKKSDNLKIEVWGDGEQTRTFMYIDDCITGLDKLMESDFSDPINLGRSELVSINQLIDIISEIAGVEVEREHNLDAPQGVRGRSSDNSLILDKLKWEPEVNLKTGLVQTYAWIEEQIEREARGESVIS
ncbi:NAD-dependent epimerase/dehydratase family protein [Verrucomicrobiales bacterium]|nr:NAD-dependent epimerase/dehydratase family protein [Verrucomicrobiales bacterium]MDB4737532.1 NAD-dependent epimerase/dehydratase family protein [Verrucomicrobiales bacterium]NCG26589.1 NAD-dependent epimerase/dehydratase family protein [Verrucomicrobiales bacterium]|tara:strand:- start:2023 stop:3015 length:993 start_codon:yes stop_codon:yes gene_type:complete